MFSDSAGGMQRVGDWPTLRRRWTDVMEGRRNFAPIDPGLPSAFNENPGEAQDRGRWQITWRPRKGERF
jgi:hypothetical protein